jgi:hypothetical protein
VFIFPYNAAQNSQRNLWGKIEQEKEKEDNQGTNT